MVSMADREGPLYWYWSANQVIAYNLGRAREAKGWSQEEAGRRLEPHLGTAWSKATFSQAERSIDPGKSRAFSADEIVAFADTFELPVTWFFLPPPPGTDGTPTRAETGQTSTEYATDLRRLLTRVAGTAEHRAHIQQRLDTFAAEINARALTDAVNIVATAAANLRVDEPTPADELRRWRDALRAVADGLGAIETAVAQRDELSVERDAMDWPDLRTIELPTLEPRGERVHRKRSAPEHEL